MGEVYQNLPSKIFDDPNLKNDTNQLTTMLTRELPYKQTLEIQQVAKMQYTLDKHQLKTHKQRKICLKKKFLTRKERKNLNLLKLSKNLEWKWSEQQKIHQLWLEYAKNIMKKYLNKPPKCNDSDWLTFTTQLNRMELIGAHLKVIRSRVPSMIGLNGIVVMETKETFQIVTKSNELKILPKIWTVFAIKIEKIRLIIYGKTLTIRPNDRSSKKIKTTCLPDI